MKTAILLLFSIIELYAAAPPVPPRMIANPFTTNAQGAPITNASPFRQTSPLTVVVPSGTNLLSYRTWIEGSLTHSRVEFDATTFGVQGDDSTDDTSAMQAAVDYVLASGTFPTLLVPSGVIKLTSPLVLTNAIRFKCSGRIGASSWTPLEVKGTMLKYYGTGACMVVQVPTNFCYKLDMEDVRFGTDGQSPKPNGIELYDTSEINLSKLNFTDGFAKAIVLHGGTILNLDRIEANGNDVSLELIDSTVSSYPTDVTINGGNFFNNTIANVRIASTMRSVTFNSTHFEWAPVNVLIHPTNYIASQVQSINQLSFNSCVFSTGNTNLFPNSHSVVIDANSTSNGLSLNGLHFRDCFMYNQGSSNAIVIRVAQNTNSFTQIRGVIIENCQANTITNSMVYSDWQNSVVTFLGSTICWDGFVGGNVMPLYSGNGFWHVNKPGIDYWDMNGMPIRLPTRGPNAWIPTLFGFNSGSGRPQWADNSTNLNQVASATFDGAPLSPLRTSAAPTNIMGAIFLADGYTYDPLSVGDGSYFYTWDGTNNVPLTRANLPSWNYTADLFAFPNQTGGVFRNNGAVAQLQVVLIPPVPGRHFIFANTNSLGYRIFPYTGCAIQWGSKRVVAPGYIEITNPGDVVHLVGWSTDTYVAISSSGTMPSASLRMIGLTNQAATSITFEQQDGTTRGFLSYPTPGADKLQLRNSLNGGIDIVDTSGITNWGPTTFYQDGIAARLSALSANAEQQIAVDDSTGTRRATIGYAVSSNVMVVTNKHNSGIVLGDSTGITVPGLVQAKTGTETTYARAGGNLKTDTTDNATVDGSERTLTNYQVPASTLATNGDYLEARAFGTFAANGNNKTVNIYFGSTLIFTTTALAFNNATWDAQITIIRTGATSQKAIVNFRTSSALLVSTATYTAASETLANAQFFYCTGIGTSANDVVERGFTVRWYPAQ